MKTMEIWKDISEYNGLYQISTFGNVKSLSKQRSESQKHIITKEKILKPSISKQGYSRVVLTKHSKHKGYLVHRLVALTFLPKIDGKTFVNHKDCNKTNNNIDNLEWCSSIENTSHAMKNGLMNWNTPAKGEKSGRSKLLLNQVLEIKSLLKRFSDVQISKKYNVTPAAIYYIRIGKNWK